MVRFTALDVFWAIAFLLLMVGGAFFFYRLARRSESDFFLAGRGLPWWLPASSVFSTHTTTDTPMWSWIWMPAELVVEVSEDGETFAEAGRTGHDVPDDVEGVFVRDMVVALDGRQVRKIRFHAVNYGTIPGWHPGAGGEAFIFVDELIVNKR